MRVLTLYILVLTCLIISSDAQTNNGTCQYDAVCRNHSSCVLKQCLCDDGYVSDFSNDTYCVIKLDTGCQQENCIMCDPSSDVRCLTCHRGTPLDNNSGRCVSNCAIGTQIEIIKLENSTISRLICIPGTTPADPNAPTWVFAVIVLILLLILVGVGVVICYLIYIRYKVLIPNLNWKQKSFELSTVEANTRAGAAPGLKKDSAVEIVKGMVRPDISSCSSEITPSIPDKDTDTKSIITTTDITSLQSEDSVSATNPGFERDVSPEKLAEEFNEKLNALRERAPTFLQMLNDMRRRLKELPPDHQNVAQYKAVMRDVTRLLYILNKRPENVEIPPDGVKLLSWAERILQRYHTAHEQAKKLAKEKRQPQGQGVKPRVSMILGEQDETKF